MIDSHCHLNFPAIKSDIKNIIKRSEESGVTKLLTINTNPNKFDDHFIRLARNVYKLNDKRAEIKLAINNALGSNIKEVKSYE